ncbi:hypothetical protein HX870_24810 [Pseudomonas gingeri]|uniref:hypothetical protein n=1 Tax=Pseudomonas gingeri TaxID=117681 RepID=UPI0015A0E942|nr:hypothetical protein [Pseudomonas gingeri]NWA26985.1 hypothetical protein [Pseudomonas gingeri]NWD70821.1 hypothetical protein [Pseudomonas gingeri]NWD72927.1 hypothetical protein [Pseudomonas gingeri]
MEVVVHEDEIKSCLRARTLVHAGVTSCLTVTAILQNEIVGLHVVQFSADEVAYPQRLVLLMQRFNQRIHGRVIDALYIVAPLAFFPPDYEDEVQQMVINAPVATLIDITDSSEKGNDIYFIGSARVVQVQVGGRIVVRQQW